MNGVQHYGESETGRFVDQNQMVRDIVREIGQIGINERQRVFMIYLLAIELEDIELMKNITGFIKEHDNKALIMGKDDEEDGTTTE